MSFFHIALRDVSRPLGIILTSEVTVTTFIQDYIFMFDAMSFYLSLFMCGVITYVAPRHIGDVFGHACTGPMPICTLIHNPLQST